MREDEIRVAIVFVVGTLDPGWKLPDREVHAADHERGERMVVPVARNDERLYAERVAEPLDRPVAMCDSKKRST